MSTYEAPPALVSVRWSTTTMARCSHLTKAGCLRRWGTVLFSGGVSTATTSSVVRLRSGFDAPAISAADFVLVRSEGELQAAAGLHRGAVMIVSDEGLEKLPQAADCARLISVPAKFDY